MINKSFTEEHFLNRLSVYRNRVIDCLKDFSVTGYPERLSQAVFYYAVYRDLGLTFMLPFDDWVVLVKEAKA